MTKRKKVFLKKRTLLRWAKRSLSGILAAVTLATSFDYSPLVVYGAEVIDAIASAAYHDNAFEYGLFVGSESQGVEINAGHFCLDGDMHGNEDFVYRGTGINVTGRLETVGEMTISVSDPEYEEHIGSMKEDCAVLPMPDITEEIEAVVLEDCQLYHGYAGFYGEEILVSTPIYVAGSAGIGSGVFEGDGTLYATESIYYSCGEVGNLNDGKVLFVAENGNIQINASNTTLNGILYAPRGNVTITGENVTINGRIIANSFHFYGSNLNIVVGEDDLSLLTPYLEEEDKAPVAMLFGPEYVLRGETGVAYVTLNDASTSPDGDALLKELCVSFDSDGDGSYETVVFQKAGESGAQEFTLGTPGQYRASITVTEDTENGLSDSTDFYFEVLNQAPTVSGRILPERSLNVVRLIGENDTGDETVEGTLSSLREDGYEVSYVEYALSGNRVVTMAEQQSIAMNEDISTAGEEADEDGMPGASEETGSSGNAGGVESEHTGDAGNGIVLTGNTLYGEDHTYALSWEMMEGAQTEGFRLLRRQEDGAYTSISTWDGERQIRVLNVYPENGVRDTFTQWMQSPLGNTGIRADHGLFDITAVYLVDFNASPEAYLQDEEGRYLYDVIFFGASDSNAGRDLSDVAVEAVEGHIADGRGVLFGHDTVCLAGGAIHPNFASFSDELGIISSTNNRNTRSNQVEVLREGTLTSYPWEISGTLMIPQSHTQGQLAGGSLPGTVWMRYLITPSITDSATGATNDAYLVTNNQAALIQTGHLNGNASIDERKILANTICYLAQRTEEQEAKDVTAYDEAAPVVTGLTSSYTDLTLTGMEISITGEDRGTTYTYYVEGIPAREGEDAENATEDGVYYSNTVSYESISGMAGFVVEISNSMASGDMEVTYDAEGNIENLQPAENGRLTIEVPSEYMGQDCYVHVLAVDHAGNVSEEQVFSPDTTPEIFDPEEFLLSEADYILLDGDHAFASVYEQARLEKAILETGAYVILLDDENTDRDGAVWGGISIDLVVTGEAELYARMAEREEEREENWQEHALVGDTVSYEVFYADPEADPCYAVRYGALVAGEMIYGDAPELTLTEPGTYSFGVQVQDNPVGELEGLSGYRLWSEEVMLLENASVSYRPVVSLSVTASYEETIFGYETQVIPEAYVPGMEQEENQGIAEILYSYKRVGDATWTEGELPEVLSYGDVYIVKAVAVDTRGVESLPAVAIVDTLSGEAPLVSGHVAPIKQVELLLLEGEIGEESALFAGLEALEAEGVAVLTRTLSLDEFLSMGSVFEKEGSARYVVYLGDALTEMDTARVLERGLEEGAMVTLTYEEDALLSTIYEDAERLPGTIENGILLGQEVSFHGTYEALEESGLANVRFIVDYRDFVTGRSQVTTLETEPALALPGVYDIYLQVAPIYENGSLGSYGEMIPMAEDLMVYERPEAEMQVNLTGDAEDYQTVLAESTYESEAYGNGNAIREETYGYMLLPAASLTESALPEALERDRIYVAYYQVTDGNGVSSYPVAEIVDTHGVPVPDTTAPAVYIESPAEEEILADYVTVLGSVSDDGGEVSYTLTLYNDEEEPVWQSSGSGTHSAESLGSFDTRGMENGFYTLSLLATDEAGNEGVTSVSVVIARPLITLTGAAISEDTLLIYGEKDTVNTLAEVTYSYEREGSGERIEVEPYEDGEALFGVPIEDLEAGTYYFYAVSTDEKGFGSESALTITLYGTGEETPEAESGGALQLWFEDVYFTQGSVSGNDMEDNSASENSVSGNSAGNETVSGNDAGDETVSENEAEEDTLRENEASQNTVSGNNVNNNNVSGNNASAAANEENNISGDEGTDEAEEETADEEDSEEDSDSNIENSEEDTPSEVEVVSSETTVTNPEEPETVNKSRGAEVSTGSSNEEDAADVDSTGDTEACEEVLCITGGYVAEEALSEQVFTLQNMDTLEEIPLTIELSEGSITLLAEKDALESGTYRVEGRLRDERGQEAYASMTFTLTMDSETEISAPSYVLPAIEEVRLREDNSALDILGTRGEGITLSYVCENTETGEEITVELPEESEAEENLLAYIPTEDLESGTYTLFVTMTEEGGEDVAVYHHTFAYTKGSSGSLSLSENNAGEQPDTPSEPSDPTDSEAPSLSFSIEDEDFIITEYTPIVGSVSDNNAVSYVITATPEGSEEEILLYEGEGAVEEGVLGGIDPTLLANGSYTIAVTAYDEAGNVRMGSATCQIDCPLKVGNMFLGFTDLVTTMPFGQISLSRYYNSNNKTPGDFGYGWSMGLTGMELYESHDLSVGYTQTITGNGLSTTYALQETVCHDVTVHYGDGSTDRFRVTLSPERQSLRPIEYVTVGFTCLTSEDVTLAIDGNNNALYMDGLLLWEEESNHNGVSYVLTLENDTKIYLSEARGVTKIEDANGNVTVVTEDGYFLESSLSGNGATGTAMGITFLRDSEGRITSATDHLGHSMSYVYDTNGDLVEVINAAGESVSFVYDDAHNLLNIYDPMGNAVARNEYDENGRLLSVTDASGNTVTYDHDVEGKVETVRDRNGNVTIYTYDNQGNILSETDAYGNTAYNTYDEYGNVLTEQDKLGNLTTYTYNEEGNLIGILTPDGVRSNTTYDTATRVATVTRNDVLLATMTADENGNVTSVTEEGGNTLSFSYLANGQLSGISDSFGVCNTFTYDELGNVTRMVSGDGTANEFTYDTAGNLTGLSIIGTDGSIYRAEYSYDELGRLLQSTDEEGNVTRYSYDENGNCVSAIDALGRTYGYAYDSMGNVTMVTYPDGTRETFTYDAEGNQLTATDRTGLTVTATYDALDRITTLTYPDGTRETYTYDGNGNVLTHAGITGSVTAYEYDVRNRLISVSSDNGGTVTYTYNEAGQTASCRDALGNTYHYEYDLRGNMTSVTYPDGSHASATYDERGRLISETDANGSTTTYAYDIMNRVTGITDAYGTQHRYTYDTLGNLATVTDGNGNVTTYEYDALGRNTAVVNAAGNRREYTYDGMGKVMTAIDFDGSLTTYTYDAYDRVISITKNGETTGATYDEYGRLLTLSYGDSFVSYTYDTYGRITSRTDGIGNEVCYGYDEYGRVNTITAMRGDELLTSTTYGYNAYNQLISVTDENGNTTTYTYDLNGSCTSMTYADGTKVTYAYDECGLLINETITNPAGDIILSYAYTYGNCGECLSVVETDEEATITTTYTYDKLLRLTSETITDGNGTLTISYTYDNVGNRLSKTTTFTGEISSFAGGEAWAVYKTGTITYTYNELNQLITETSEDGTNTYAYDENGNLTSLSGEKQVSYTYNSLGYLAEATITSGGVTTWESYTYDGEGNRVSVTVRGGGRLRPETTYYVNDACSSLTQVLATIDENGNVKQTYQRGLGLISYSECLGNEGNETTYYLSDGRGSVTALLKEGSITDRYHYDAYGNLIKKSGSSENEYLYNGESYSETTGLYYQRARYMNPTTGTFISMDAYNGTTDNPVSQHKYLYANANPVMYEDPSGYMSMMEMQVGMAMKSILMGGISNMFYVSLSNDAQENGMSIGEMLEAFAVGAIYTMLGLMVALLFEILCPALLILGIILSPFIVLYNGHNAMRQAQALGEDRQAAFCYITTILGSLVAAVGGPRAAFDLMDYRMSNGIPRQGNAGQGCVGEESGNTSKIGDFSGLNGSNVDDILDRIPDDAVLRELTPVNGGATEGFEFKWMQDGQTYRVRVHNPDPSAPIGTNAHNNWVVRVQRGRQYYDYTIDDFQPARFTNPNGDFFDESIMNNTHIPIQNPYD